MLTPEQRRELRQITPRLLDSKDWTWDDDVYWGQSPEETGLPFTIILFGCGDRLCAYRLRCPVRMMLNNIHRHEAFDE